MVLGGFKLFIIFLYYLVNYGYICILVTELLRKYKLSIVHSHYKVKDFGTFMKVSLGKRFLFPFFSCFCCSSFFFAKCSQLLGVGSVNKSVIVMNNNDSLVIDLRALD